ncbi:TldD protein [Pseudomonas sp. NFIX10]|uniref:metalloprotease TldD n=1 Tax=Pseudomonas TaxID=286 RepID=UPI0008F1425A|nr:MULTISPECIES: metalloprotease TldD [unclassified Pseudomonas]SFB16212.1 TldD protein [Pseudomonas sp. NFIX10]SFE73555.1 TldD protein [Pseudomonas sp. NFACC06-1]
MNAPHTHINNLQAARQLLLEPYGLDERHLARVLDDVMAHQVDFADLYLQSVKRERWNIEGGLIKSGSFSVDQGFGLRALDQDQSAFAYSQQINERFLRDAAHAVRTIARPGGKQAQVNLQRTAPQAQYANVDPIDSVDTDAKVAILKSIDRMARAMDPRVVNVFAMVEVEQQTVMVMRHDGRLAADVRPLVIVQMNVMVANGKQREMASTGLGGRYALETLDEASIGQELRKLVDGALLNLDAIPSPSGSMPVVLGPGWTGILLHEAMGHGFEGDFNRLGTSAYSGRMGERVAPKGVNVVDDGSLVGHRGSVNIDDEGEAGQCTPLIEDGILCGYMHDNLSARLMNMSPTGNGRRQSYAHLPMPRMTNTFMRNGDLVPEEIIASVKRGLYLATPGSGQVDIVSGQFTFQSALAYLIEDGRLVAPVRGATLTGNGPQTLSQISMVGNDLALDPGMAVCGKRGQSIPVSVGQPTLKIDNLIVGGTA